MCINQLIHKSVKIGNMSQQGYFRLRILVLNKKLVLSACNIMQYVKSCRYRNDFTLLNEILMTFVFIYLGGNKIQVPICTWESVHEQIQKVKCYPFNYSMVKYTVLLWSAFWTLIQSLFVTKEESDIWFSNMWPVVNPNMFRTGY